MKRCNVILCVIIFMALGLWRAWSDSHTIGSNSYKTAAASNVTTLVTEPLQNVPVTSETEVQSIKDSTEVVDSVKVPVKKSQKPVLVTKTKITTNLAKPESKKRKHRATRQEPVIVATAEAEAFEVSNDSAMFYGKRILDIVERLDKKISAPCVEIHEDADSLSNGSH